MTWQYVPPSARIHMFTVSPFLIIPTPCYRSLNTSRSLQPGAKGETSKKLQTMCSVKIADTSVLGQLYFGEPAVYLPGQHMLFFMSFHGDTSLAMPL